MAWKSLVIALSLLFLSGMADAQTADRSVITIRHLHASPARVIEAFVDESHLGAWWQVTRSLVEPEVGGPWAVAWDDWGEERSQHSWTGVIREIGSGRLVIGNLVMIEPGMPLLGPMQLEVFAEPAEGGTTLTVTHSGYGYGDHWDEMYELVVNGWDHVLGDLQRWFGEEY